jgi:uncharacterized protein
LKAYQLRFGVGCKQNLEKAKEYGLLACSKRNKLALGMKYYFGWDCTPDPRKAYDIFNQIEYEEPENKEELKCYFFLIGRIFHYERGILQDMIKAKEYYEKSIELGDVNAMINLALIYKDSHFGLEKNLNRCIELFEKASQFGDGMVKFNSSFFFL